MEKCINRKCLENFYRYRFVIAQFFCQFYVIKSDNCLSFRCNVKNYLDKPTEFDMNHFDRSNDNRPYMALNLLNKSIR